eukprot:Sspe_Gene.95031::Locus_67371_Transcript_1_1_Confidence_1.000_Length_1545::g.95031::m.95031
MLPAKTTVKDLTKLRDSWLEKLGDLTNNDDTSMCVAFVQNFETLPSSAWSDVSSEAQQAKRDVKVAELNDVCHRAYSAVHELIASGKRHSCPITEDKAWAALKKAKWDTEAAHEHAGIVRKRLPFLEEVDFLDRECSRAALLNEDRGFLKRAGRKAFDLSAHFTSLISGDVDRSPAKIVEIEEKDGQTERVIIQDCIRTFSCLDHQKRLEAFLNGAFIEFENYNQGMAHVAAFLMLTLPENDVIVLLRKINNDYIPGHWKHESDGFGASAYVYQTILEKYEPEIAEHLKKKDHYLMPEMYTRKWFCGLGLHVLDLEYVYQFLDAFLKRGFEYLIAFAMAFVKHMKSRILDCDDIGVLLKIFMLNQDGGNCTSEDGKAILDLADTLDYRDELGTAEELAAKRKELYDKHLKERMEKAKAALNDAEDTFEECQECDSGMPAKWSVEDLDGLLVCNECKITMEGKGYEITEW